MNTITTTGKSVLTAATISLMAGISFFAYSEEGNQVLNKRMPYPPTTRPPAPEANKVIHTGPPTTEPVDHNNEWIPSAEIEKQPANPNAKSPKYPVDPLIQNKEVYSHKKTDVKPPPLSSYIVFIAGALLLIRKPKK